MSKLHIIEHEAMKTTYTLRLLTEDAALAKQVGTACIQCIDTLESQLSRHYAGSDIWQVNQMQAGQSLFVSEDCYACLRLAMQAYEQTGGLFDITLGRLIEHRKNEHDGTPPLPQGQLIIDPDRPAIHCEAPGREIDLGGIGKGYTLDRLKDICLEHGITSGLLASGASTQLSFGDQAWPIILQSGKAQLTIQLQNAALSASGTGIQGSHIVSPDPSTPKELHERIWLLTQSAAFADAWSTAAMFMPREELEAACNPQLRAYIVEKGKILDLAKKD
jgi:thiamine biosynthesis lipoprotein